MSDSSPESLVCSSRGCGNPAVWQLLWNNPKIHTPDRRKTWLACDEHKDSLSDFLDRRSFLREVETVPDGTR
jgi:hypothetical protein